MTTQYQADVAAGLDLPPVRNGLVEALADFQRDLPRIDKGIEADTGTYKYKYADLADVSAAVLPLLGRFGLCWTTAPTFNDNGKFMLRYELRHVSGESITGWYPLPPADSKPQALGSAITYARRYCLAAVTGVSPDKDDDGAAAQHAPTVTEPDWSAEIEQAVLAHNRGALVKLWNQAKRLRPDDRDLRLRIEGAGERIPAPVQSNPPAKTESASAPTVDKAIESELAKDRRALEKHLFALLGEGGITDTKAGRDTRLLIVSRLVNKVPVIPTLNDVTDTELATVNVTLERYRREERLTHELAELSRVEDPSPGDSQDQPEVESP